jgi:uncharacterized membrane protein YqiK
MKGYIAVIFAAVLLIIALVLIVTGVSNIAGLPVLGAVVVAGQFLRRKRQKAYISIQRSRM